MKKIFLIISALLVLCVIVAGPRLTTVYAGEADKAGDTTGEKESKTGDTGLFPNPSKISTIQELLDAIINFIYAMSFPVVTGVVLYAAFVMMTSQGKPEKFQQGITIIIYAAIGFVVILLSKGIVFIIRSIFGA